MRQVVGFSGHHIGLTPAPCSLVPRPPSRSARLGAPRERRNTPGITCRSQEWAQRPPHRARIDEHLNGLVDLTFLCGGERASEGAYPPQGAWRTEKIGAAERRRTPNPQFR